MKSKRELYSIFSPTRAYKERQKRSSYAKVMDFTSSRPKIQGCQVCHDEAQFAATRQVTEGVQSKEEDKVDHYDVSNPLPRRDTQK